MKKYLPYVGVVVVIIILLYFFLPSGSGGDTTLGGSSGCTSESRTAEACITLYKPVCGTLKDGSEQTYSNLCYACKNSDVKSWTEGEC